MSGVFPTAGNGGLPVRTEDGSPIPQPNVENGYVPGADFITTCQVSYLPSDCTAVLTSAQINSMVSELLCFAETLTPTGTWNCDSQCNLSAAFNAWFANLTFGEADEETITGDGTAGNPYKIIPLGTAQALCADPNAADVLAQCVISGEANNRLVISPVDGRLYVDPALDAQATATAICADDVAAQTIAACVLSEAPNNQSIISPVDSKIYTPPLWVLRGATAVAFDDINPIPTIGSPAQILQTTTFTIPNNGPVPIAVMLSVTFHCQIELAGDGPGGAIVVANVRAGNAAGPLIMNPHVHFQRRPPTSHVYDPAQAADTVVNIPPGGQLFTVQLGLEGSLSSGAGARIVSLIVRPTWFGVQATAGFIN